jgi:hypothetical protein
MNRSFVGVEFDVDVSDLSINHPSIQISIDLFIFKLSFETINSTTELRIQFVPQAVGATINPGLPI